MQHNLRRKFSLPLAGLIYLLAVLPVNAGSPGDEVRATVENVLATLRDVNLRGSDKQAERRNKLKNVIYPRFDFAEMAKRSLGPEWQRRSPAEQKQFVDLFTDLLESSYVDAIESYNGEKVAVVNERRDQNFAEVKTKIITKKGEEFTIDYKLHQAEGGWKVYDAVIENISLVNNYRSQFNRVIAKSSYEGLVSRMRQRQFDAPKKKVST